jgi:hypothetical protein
MKSIATFWPTENTRRCSPTERCCRFATPSIAIMSSVIASVIIRARLRLVRELMQVCCTAIAATQPMPVNWPMRSKPLIARTSHIGI